MHSYLLQGRAVGCGALATLIVACSAGPVPTQQPEVNGVEVRAAAPAAEEDPNVLVLEGPVNEAMRQQFHAAIESRPITTVRITSAANGTNSNPRNLPALWMADVIRDRGIAVTVRGVCAESCANYIFVAARKRKVQADSLVLFGPSVTTLRATQQTVGDQFPPDFEPMFRALDSLAEAEARLYQMRGAPLSLLTDSALARQPYCVVFFRREGTAPQSFSVNLRYGGWIPSREYLDAAGIALEGYWPTSRRELERVARKLGGPQLARTTRFADEDHLRKRGKAPFKMEDIRECVLEQVAP